MDEIGRLNSHKTHDTRQHERKHTAVPTQCALVTQAGHAARQTIVTLPHHPLSTPSAIFPVCPASVVLDESNLHLNSKGNRQFVIHMEDIIAGKLLSLAAVAANSAAADLAAGGESEEEDTCSWSREGSRDSGLYDEGSEEDDEEGDGVGGKRKRMSVDDRKARNRERNRLHARKTRQRKKQHVQELQLKIWGLRQERQRLLQLSTEHRTAGVLLALSCSPKQCVQRAGTGSSSISRSANSPRLPPTLKLPKTAVTAAASASGTRDWNQEVALHEDALRKITQEFERMDGSQQVGEEDELASAGAAAGNVGRGRAQSSSSSTSSTGGGGAGGGKGGSRGAKGTLADRTALRRERNRMHAKRTRNRKKLFVEACSVMIDKMVSHNFPIFSSILLSFFKINKNSVWNQNIWSQ